MAKHIQETNIKTIGGQSLIGSGDIPISPDLSAYIKQDDFNEVFGNFSLDTYNKRFTVNNSGGNFRIVRIVDEGDNESLEMGPTGFTVTRTGDNTTYTPSNLVGFSNRDGIGGNWMITLPSGNSNLEFPKSGNYEVTKRYIATSIDGQFADINGNITSVAKYKDVRTITESETLTKVNAVGNLLLVDALTEDVNLSLDAASMAIGDYLEIHRYQSDFNVSLEIPSGYSFRTNDNGSYTNAPVSLSSNITKIIKISATQFLVPAFSAT